jgi:hypothetical protein
MTTKLSDKNHTFIAILAFALLLAVFYWKVLFEGNVSAFVDASRFFYPIWNWGAGVLSQGLIPLWNPDAQWGTPYLADPQMACAYPPVFIFYSWFNPVDAFSALILFHHFWAMTGFWFLARGQGYSAKISFWGSLAFGFSLQLVCSSWTPVALMTISWVPWVFFSAERLFQKKPGGVLFLSFTWAMQLSAGYPVLVYLTGLALVGQLGWQSWKSFRRKENPSLDGLGGMGLAVGIAVLYNLVWGLPFFEFLKNSNYQNGASRFQDLSWINLATFFDPFVLGHPLAGNYQGPHYWVATFFVGLPTLCLLGWGLVNRVYQKNTPWLLLLFLVLSLGSNLKLADGLKLFLPGYALVIHSGFWISLAVLWVILLAMESLAFLMNQGKLQRGAVSWVAIAAGVYGITYFMENRYFSVFFGLSFALVLAVFWIRDKIGKWLAIFGALGLSLLPAAYSVNMTMDRSYYDKPPLVLSHLGHPGRLFFSPVLLGSAVRLQGQNMNDAYENAKQNVYPNWPLAYGKEEVPIYNTLQLADSFAWTFQVFQHSLKESRRAIDLLGIRYVFGPSGFKDLKAIETNNERVKVSENPSSFPYWFSVSKAIAAGPTPNDDFIKADKDDLNYGNICFVENPAQTGNYQKRQVTEVSRTVNWVLLSAVGKGKALLVSSETEAPGWKAWIEGKPKQIEKVNDAFRGVVLEEGESHVVLKYEPLSFRVGLFFALLVCALWMGLVVGWFRENFLGQK